MGPGSAAHRRRGAALRPGHESLNFSSIAIRIIRAASHSRGGSRPSFASIAALKSAEGAGKAGCRLFQVMPTMEYMRASIEDAKAMTKSLRESLVARNVSLGR
jgi:hypothetical protein